MTSLLLQELGYMYYLLSNYFVLLLSEYDFLSGIVVKEEIEISFENNEEAGPSGIAMK